MSNKSLGSRARKVAAGIALGTFAVAAQADPFTLQGTCHVVSLTAIQGCQLSYLLSDDFTTPASVRKAQIRVNGTVIAQYVNDTDNPADFSAQLVSGSTNVACGASYTVTGYIARSTPANSTYEKVGALPPVACPAQP